MSAPSAGSCLKEGVRVLFADDQTTHHYASIFRQLRKQGTPIPTNDMWLAALVLQHNIACTLETGTSITSRRLSASESRRGRLTLLTRK